MKVAALIPARYAATRFPFKLMQKLGNKTVIRHTYDNSVATELFDEVLVVTDHEIIFNEIISNGGKAVMSNREHESGTDRIAEAVAEKDFDIILNVQGDEPFVNKELLASLLQTFRDDAEYKIQVASPVKRITDKSAVNNPNIVKVALDLQMNALLFSRSPVPFHREQTIDPVYYEHIGIYAFRKQALLKFTELKPTPLELAEKIECLRFLENGIQLRMIETDAVMVKIDVPEDLPKAEAYFQKLNNKQ